MARIKAVRALACAIANPAPLCEERKVMLDRESSPMATTVRSIISVSVTTRANPRTANLGFRIIFMEFSDRRGACAFHRLFS